MALMTPMVLCLAACRGERSTLDPAGPAAQQIASLWWAMFTGAALIFVLVIGLLAWTLRKRTTGRPPSPRTWIVMGGLVFPAIVLTLTLGFSSVIGERLLPRAGPDTITVDVEAAQWRWTFAQDLPAGRVQHEGTLHIPVGQPVDLRIRSADVIHSVWVPRLAGKLDAIPGRINTLRVQAERAGVYEGQCAEYCGVGHRVMGFRVVAHDAQAWQAFGQGKSR